MARDLEDLVDGATKGIAHPRHIDRVYFRAKDPASFTKKVARPKSGIPYGDPFAEIEDQIAGRVLVFFRHDIDLVNRRMIDTLREIEFSRREPESSAEFGYESDHWVCLIPRALMSDEWLGEGAMPRTFELQVRTLFMHAWAEPLHDIVYKPDQSLDRDTERRVAWIAASSWGADEMLEPIWNAEEAREASP